MLVRAHYDVKCIMHCMVMRYGDERHGHDESLYGDERYESCMVMRDMVMMFRAPQTV